MKTFFRHVIFIILIAILFLQFGCRWFDPSVRYTSQETKDPNAMLEKGREYFIQDYDHVAIKVYTDIINRKFPQAKPTVTTTAKGWAFYERGFIYFKNGKYSKAKKDLKFLINNFDISSAKRLATRLINKMEKGEPKKRSTYSDD